MEIHASPTCERIWLPPESLSARGHSVHWLEPSKDGESIHSKANLFSLLGSHCWFREYHQSNEPELERGLYKFKFSWFQCKMVGREGKEGKFCFVRSCWLNSLSPRRLPKAAVIWPSWGCSDNLLWQLPFIPPDSRYPSLGAANTQRPNKCHSGSDW